ncbi:MAG: ABC transporter ATP-binding protein [Desulfarculaceae bacterium]|jgi:oligopeptide/dipeptide ABC transporter ATP-binding protein
MTSKPTQDQYSQDTSSLDQYVLKVKDLRTWFLTPEGLVRAVDGMSFQLSPGQTLGIVGESGCGKSVTARTILRLLAMPPAYIVGGEIWLGDCNLLDLSEEEMRKIRGNEISMIFQEPMTSLNPVLSVGYQLREAIRLHRPVSIGEAGEIAVDMMKMVQIPDPKRRLKQYPHEMSGGMRQRVMIAMALSCRPKVLIADEPTTALDVTIQAQITDLIADLKEQTGTGVILITHDLGLIAETAQQVIVMYAGSVVESAPVKDLFSNPLHPYTRGLMESLPKLGSSGLKEWRREALAEIPGMVPTLIDLPQGCKFAPRCSLAEEQCHRSAPEFKTARQNHGVSCWKASLSPEGGVS